MNLNEEEYKNSLDCMIDSWNNLRNEFKEGECTFALMIGVFKMKIIEDRGLEDLQIYQEILKQPMQV